MIVKCKKCNKRYERFDIGDYGTPNLCDKCSKKNKSLFLFIFMFLFLVPFISSQQIVKQNSIYDIKVQCINNGSFCSSNAKCNVTLMYPNNSINIDNKAMTNQYSFYNYTLNNTNSVGIYQCSSTCCDGSYCGNDKTCSFEVTPSGTQPSIFQGILYALVLGFLLMLFLLSLYFSIAIKGSNIRGDNGKVLQINWKKNVKFVLWFMNYILFMFIIGVFYDISLNFFSTINSISNLFGILFEWMIGLTLPIFGLTFAIMVIILISDKKTQKTLSRGIPTR